MVRGQKDGISCAKQNPKITIIKKKCMFLNRGSGGSVRLFVPTIKTN